MIFAPYIHRSDSPRGPEYVMLCAHAQTVVSQAGNDRLTSFLAVMNETRRGYSLVPGGPVECVQAQGVRVVSQQFLASARLSFDDERKPIGGGAGKM